MAQSLSSINFKLLANIEDFSTKMQNAERTLKKFGNKTKKIGRNMSRNFSAPLLGVGIAAVKVAADFETSFSKMENLVGITGDELKKFKKSVLELSGTTSKAPKELADALFFITSAGLRGDVALQALSASAKASAIGMGETSTVADAVTSIMNSYGKEVMSAARSTDLLTALVREGKVASEEIAPVIGKVVGVASQMGISFEEVAASMATFTRLGVPAAEAATGLRAVMNSIIKPTTESKTALNSIGLTFDDLRKKIRKEGLANTLIFLTKAFEGNLEGLGTLIPNVKALGTVMSTAGAQAETYQSILDNISNSTGIVDQGFKKVSETAGFKFKRALSDLISIGIEIGNSLLPTVLKLLDRVKFLAQGFKNLSESTKKTIVVVAAIVGVIGPLLIIIGSLSTGLAALVPVFSIVIAEFKLLSLAIAANPIGALLVGLSTLAAYWLISANNNSVANTELDKTATKAKTAADRLAEINDELERSGKTRFQTIREELEANLDPLKAQADELKERISLLNEELDAGWSLETLKQIVKLGSEYKIIAKQANGYIGALNKLTKKEQDQAKALKDSASAANELASSYEEVETSTPTLNPILPSYSQLSGLDFQASAGNEASGEDPLKLTGLELRLENATNSVTKFFDKWGSSINMVGDLFGQMLDNKLQKLDNYHAKESERIQNSTLTEEEKAVAQEELDEQVAAKRAKLQRKQAKLEKAANLASAIMNGALAISATLGKSGFLGIPLSIIVKTLAAAQVATIAATPIPAFAEGGVVFGPTVGLMGEYSGARNNPEIIAPLSKLKSLLGDSMHGDNTFIPDVRIAGDDILIVYDRAKRRKERR